MKRWSWTVLCLLVIACGDDDGATTMDATVDAAEAIDASMRDVNTRDADMRDAPIASCGPLVGRSVECTQCLRAECCPSLAACGADPDCIDLVQCLRDCDVDADTDCMGDCVARLGISPQYNPLVLCGANQCATECPFASP